MTVNVYRVVIQVIDFHHDMSEEEVRHEIENSRYLNVKAVDVEKKQVEWTDDHPLNMGATTEQAFKELFPAHE